MYLNRVWKNRFQLSNIKKCKETIEVSTEHLSKFMKKPKTVSERQHERRMKNEWTNSLVFGILMYVHGDKLWPGSFVDRRWFTNFPDEKAMYWKSKYLKGEIS